MQRDDDDAWRAIVDNYGDRAELDPAEELPSPQPERSAMSYDDPDEDVETWHDAEDGYVPPPLPPIPRPPNDRLAAWIGVLGAPLVLLVCAVAQIDLAEWVALALVAAFVGGFLYLVFRTPRSPRDPWDDGARV